MKGYEIKFENNEKIIKGTGVLKGKKVKNFRELVNNSAAKYKNAVAFKVKDKKTKTVKDISYIEFKRQVDTLGQAMYEKYDIENAEKEMRFGIIGENCYEWALSYMAVVTGLGVVVPLDKNLPELEIINLVKRGKIDVMIFTEKYIDVMESIKNENLGVKDFICMTQLEGMIDSFKGDTSTFANLPQDEESMRALLFTSGTTSLAKGVMLSAKNICSTVEAGLKHIYLDERDVYLSLLPLHHTFENSVGFLLMIAAGATIAYCDGLKYIQKNLQEYKISIIGAVPAIIEVLYKRVFEGIEKSGKAKLVKFLIKVSQGLRKIGIDMRHVFFSSIFKQLSPALRLGVVGAAPIDPKIVSDFDKLGFKLIQGYGLTETAPLLAGNTDDANIAGTVGIPVAEVELKIDSPDENGMGEIMAKGPNVMLGYYEDEEATKEVLNDGWFRTGDLGIIDEYACLKITGRCKSMIVFENGKKAFPEEYEVLLNSEDLISDSFVWGNVDEESGQVRICAKIIPNRADESDEELVEALGEIVKKINENLPNYKIIRYFFISNDDIIKTTTLKTKRPQELAAVKEKLAAKGEELRKLNKAFI